MKAPEGMMRFKAKVVIVTGGAKGIGRAVARLFAQEGAEVIIVDSDAENGRKTTAAIRKTGGHAVFIKTDVSRSDEIRQALTAVEKEYRRIDVLVNNAGIYGRGDVVSTSEELWTRIIQVNLSSVYLFSRAVIPVMKRGGGGVIVNVSSSVGLHASAPGIAAYTASKGGVTSLTRAMANDHLKDNIRVNCVCPGPTDTPLLRGSRTKQQLKAFIGGLPARKLQRPEEVAKTILFLASEEAVALTGAAIPVDRGQTAHL
jgi:NAD(P)-dependent dehydrogenase (short-subunit alcohol dehydrogenase family)